MITLQTETQNATFTKEDISGQLQKIFCDPIFAHAEILKRFLSFIVRETLTGNSNRLKEYTIAVNVLQKPVSFNTQETGIVRIHAGRLRRALNQYYNTRGLSDSIRIGIPLGHYVPVFTGPGKSAEPKNHLNSASSRSKMVLLSVVPFWDVYHDPLKNSLTESVGAQLTMSLIQLRSFGVVTHFSMGNAPARITDIQGMGSAVGAFWAIAAGIHSLNDRIRISIQMIRTETGEQVWSNSYERKFNSSNIFDVRDEMIRQIISELEGMII
jgi:TolB-like protein